MWAGVRGGEGRDGGGSVGCAWLLGREGEGRMGWGGRARTMSLNESIPNSEQDGLITPAMIHGFTGHVRRIVWFDFTVLQVGATLLATLSAIQGVRITGSCPTPRARDPGLHRPPADALAACVPVFSCTAPRHHGRITHQPEEVPHEVRPRPAVCYLPLSHGHRSVNSVTEELGGGVAAVGALTWFIWRLMWSCARGA